VAATNVVVPVVPVVPVAVAVNDVVVVEPNSLAATPAGHVTVTTTHPPVLSTAAQVKFISYWSRSEALEAQI
jgi:hypothetical protein